MKAAPVVIVGTWMALLVLFGFVLGRKTAVPGGNGPMEAKVDTLTICDTITLSKPVYVERRVVDSVMVPVCDTIRVTDTLYLALPRELVVWEDSLSRVYASGVFPSVDSVAHFVQTTIITKEVPVEVVRKCRWGLGIQAGAGAGKDGLTPYIGVGVTYNILSW